MRAATITTHGRAARAARPRRPRRRGRASCSSPSPPCRSRPLDLFCASGTSYFGAHRPCPTCPACRPSGVVRDGPAELVGRRVWFPTTAGMAPGRRRDGRAGRRERRRGRGRRRRPAPTSRSPRSACRRSPPGRCSRPGPRCAPGRPCSCSGPAASSARSPCRPPACSAPAASSRRPARPSRRNGLSPAARTPWSTSAATTSRPWPSGCATACEGRRRRRRRPARRHPRVRPPRRVLGGRRTPGQPGQQRRAALSVDSAALRSRSAAVLGYTNNALTDARRRAVFGDGAHPRRAPVASR